MLYPIDKDRVKPVRLHLPNDCCWLNFNKNLTGFRVLMMHFLFTVTSEFFLGRNPMRLDWIYDGTVFEN